MPEHFYRNALTTELDYKDVFIVPQYSEITSRKEVNTQGVLFFGNPKIDAATLQIPIISANMDTVTDDHVAVEMSHCGGFGALHRFMPIDLNVEYYKSVRRYQQDCLVSVGVNEESRARAIALYEVGAKYFVIDIAHGHSLMMKNMITWMRETFGENVLIMAGNVATAEGATDLAEWGADSVKVGVGPGAVCITKNQTGVTFPQFSAVQECSRAIQIWNESNKRVTVVADGGLSEYGDVAKALAAGANTVMSGKFFSNLANSPGDKIEVNGKTFKTYRGMASKAAMATIKREEDMATPEGKEELIEVSNETIASVLKDLKGALQSSMSYSNARTMKEFRERVKFGIRNR